MGIIDFFKKAKKAKAILMFYSNYPEIPFISDERNIGDWIEQATLMPKQSLVDKKMMQRYDDGLLPGHIYMLYWLQKYTNKKVPAYFEYKYGIDFEKEKGFLCEKLYLDNTNKPTPKGVDAITKHYDIIENHAPKNDRSINGISEQILAQRDSFVRNGFRSYTFHANRDCCEICATLNGKHFPISKFKIGVTAPPMHDKCRCSISAYEETIDYEAWLDHLEKGGTTKDWRKHKRK